MQGKFYSDKIEILIKLLAKLPGLGPRSARRATLQLIKKRESLMEPLAEILKEVANNIIICGNCGNIDICSPCNICIDQTRDNNILIVVEEISDLWALERSMILKAKYHILGGHLSPLDGITEQDLNINNLLYRAKKENFQEIILALNATIEGQTTAHYLKKILQPYAAQITQLAQGVPLGGELDYLDEGTLAQAIGKRIKL